jgi:serine/threonine protein kinase
MNKVEKSFEAISDEPVDFSGSQFNDYQVIKQVGEGQFGRVYKAKHKETNKVVALK